MIKVEQWCELLVKYIVLQRNNIGDCLSRATHKGYIISVSTITLQRTLRKVTGI